MTHLPTHAPFNADVLRRSRGALDRELLAGAAGPSAAAHDELASKPGLMLELADRGVGCPVASRRGR
jgi:hypothetical protein